MGVEIFARSHRRAVGAFSLPALLLFAVALALFLSFLVHRRARFTDHRIHVTYWEKWNGEDASSMQAVVEAFNRSQDQITVDYLSIGDIDRKTLIATAGGNPPDIAGLWSFSVYGYVDRNALLPLDDFMAEEGFSTEQWLERYFPVYAEMCRYRGHVWGLPSNAAVIGFYWNKKLFRRAGLDPDRPPQTIAELDAFAAKLTLKDPATGRIRQIGYLPQEPLYYTWTYPLWFGGQLWDTHNITLATPRNLDCYRWVESYSRRYGLPAIQSFTSGFGNPYSPQGGFFSGQIAMQVQGVWFTHSIDQYAPGMEYGVSGWPSGFPGQKDFCMAESDSLVIPRGAKNPRAAWEFIKYANSSNPHAQTKEELRGMELMCYLQYKLSPLREWSPYFQHHHPNPHIETFKRLAASPFAVSFPKIGLWPEYNAELNVLFDKSRLLAASPDEAIAYAQERLERSWKRHQESQERRAQTGGLPP
jgi:ABC-type glycerol-3-phosphate transport system substrate-binding protein